MKVAHFDQLSHRELCRDIERFINNTSNIKIISLTEVFATESRGYFNATLIYTENI